MSQLKLKPPPGGLTLAVVPTTYTLGDEQLFHPKILWQTYASAMLQGLILVPDVEQVLICTRTFSRIIVRQLIAEAKQHGICDVHTWPSFLEIEEWALRLPRGHNGNHNGAQAQAAQAMIDAAILEAEQQANVLARARQLQTIVEKLKAL